MSDIDPSPGHQTKLDDLQVETTEMVDEEMPGQPRCGKCGSSCHPTDDEGGVRP